MFTLADLLAVLGAPGPLLPPGEATAFSEVSIDSRQCSSGDLFVALPGEHQDGHDFIQEALAAGCAGALARSDQVPLPLRAALALPVYTWDGRRWARTGPDRGGAALILVPEVLAALQQLAARWRARFSPTMIGITGSVGKSSTKELLAAVLARRFVTLKSEKSFNNEIGLPLTLLRLQAQHQVVVVEMGTYGPGEITQLTDIARPQIGVVTNVSHSHLERMGTLETIAQAKAELPAALPSDGLAVLNGDEPLVRAMAAQTRATVLLYGLSEGCHLRALEVESQGLEGIVFRVQEGPARHVMRCRLPGQHSVYGALAATAVGRHLGMHWDEIGAGLVDPDARLRLLSVPGPAGSTLIDDTYNASPVSCRAALDLLADLPGRRIAVLGDMLELGSFEEQGHRLVGEWAAEVAEQLVVVGPLARRIGEAALARGMNAGQVHFTETCADATRILQDHLQQGDVVLIKGSRAMEMERIVEALRQAEPALSEPSTARGEP